jgi:hypothetical protein
MPQLQTQQSSANLPPFRAAAARHRNLAYTRPWPGMGQPLFQTLNRQGYLAALRFNLNLTVVPTVVAAGGDVPDADTLNNFFPLIALKSPQGDYLWSASMRSFLDFNYRLRYGIKPVSDTITSGDIDPTYVAINPASAASQVTNINFEIPISLNWGLNFETGLLMRQLANNDFTLQLNAANFTDLATGPAVGTAAHIFFGAPAITGNIFIEEEWYEAVNPNVVMPPDFHAIIKLRDQLYGGLVAGGDNVIPYATGPTLLDIISRVTSNNAADATASDVNYIKVVANKQTEIENRRGADIRRDNFLQLGKAMRLGIYHLDFFDDSDICNQTRARDFINSNMASQLDQVVNLVAAFNVTSSSVISFFRELVTLGV